MSVDRQAWLEVVPIISEGVLLSLKLGGYPTPSETEWADLARTQVGVILRLLGEGADVPAVHALAGEIGAAAVIAVLGPAPRLTRPKPPVLQ